MKIKKAGSAAFTLVEIMIVVAIIGMLAAIAVPNFAKARRTAQKNACVNNLRMVDNAKEQWALETKTTDENVVPPKEGVGEYIKNGFPECPGGGTYDIRAIKESPKCTKETEGHTLAQ